MDNLPAMGRDITIGFLYDIRTDQIINRSLWDEEMRKAVTVEEKPDTSFNIVVSDTFQSRTKLMDVEAEVSLSLMGLGSLTGSAKYLNSRTTSTKKSSVTLKLKTRDRFERLNENQLSHVSYPNNLEIEEATHVISHISYGNDAYFKFEKVVKDGETKDEVAGSLGVAINVGIGEIKGKGSVSFQDNQKDMGTDVRCEFNGDFALNTLPTTFESAMEVLENLLNPETKKTAIPMTFSLIPLHQLDSSASRLVRSLGAALVDKAILIKNYQENCLQQLDALLESEIFRNNSFEDVRRFIAEVKRVFSGSDSKFKKGLSEILPKIKGAGAEENELLTLLSLFEQSSFGEPKFKHWYNRISSEVRFMENIMKRVQSAPNIRICPSDSFASELRFEHGYENGWYELDINLLSCLNWTLVTHLETELENPEKEDVDNYPMDPSFITADGANHFLRSLSQKIQAFKELSQLEDNANNKNLCFVAKIIYPAKDQNLASINFEQNEAANNNVNLDIELGMKQIPSTEEGRAEFCFTVTPGTEKETEALPDIEVEFRYKQHLIGNEFNPIKTSDVLKGGGETNMSVSIPSSVFPYVCQARAKYIGGAVGPWIEKETNAVQAFHVLEFVDLRYESTWSEFENVLMVNIKNVNVAEHNQNKTEDEEKEGKEKLSPLFDVQFEYRFLGSENDTIFKTTAVLMDDDYMSVLPDVEGNTIEFRCRYVVCQNDNMQAFTMMDGSLVGEWTDFESCEIGR